MKGIKCNLPVQMMSMFCVIIHGKSCALGICFDCSDDVLRFHLEKIFL